MNESVNAAVIFRTAREEDANALVQLINAAYRPTAGMAGWTHEGAMIDGPRITAALIFDTLQAPNSALILAVVEEKIVGCVEVRADGNEAHMGTLAVSPSMQDRGIGRSLLKEAERLASYRWRIEKSVMVVLSFRQELIDFYVRQGYVRTGELMRYPVDAGVGIPRVNGLTLEKLSKNIEFNVTGSQR